MFLLALKLLAASCRSTFYEPQDPAACKLLLWMYALNRLCKNMGPTMRSMEEVEADLSARVCVLGSRKSTQRHRRRSSLVLDANKATAERVTSKAELSAYAELDKVSNARGFRTSIEGARMGPLPHDFFVSSEWNRHCLSSCNQ